MCAYFHNVSYYQSEFFPPSNAMFYNTKHQNKPFNITFCLEIVFCLFVCCNFATESKFELVLHFIAPSSKASVLISSSFEV